MSKIATGLPRSLTVRSNTWLIQILQYGMNFYPINQMLNLFKNKFLPPATKLRHVSVILFKEGGLCPSIHHRSHGQEGLCLRGSLSRGGLCSGGSLSRGVSVQGGLCLMSLCPWGDPRQRPPLYSNARALRILLECILVLIFFQMGKFSES